MRHTLLNLRPIAVCFPLFPLHAPDGKCAHKQNIDQRQTPIAVQNAEEGIQGEIAVVVQIISPQRHDAAAHQKRKHNQRSKPSGNKLCDLFFRRGQPKRPVGAHRADDHQDHDEELRPRDGKAHIVQLRRPEARHEDGHP